MSMFLPLFFIFFLLLVFTYFGYAAVLWLLGRMPQVTSAKEGEKNLSVDVLIMTYNEERSIEKKLKNTIEQDYDRLNIYVVDSCSTDKTVEIANQYPVTIIQESVRSGKAAAVNYALKKTNGDLVLVTDANAYFQSKSTISLLVKAISAPKIGAVTGRFKALSTHGTATAIGEGLFWQYENFLRTLESRLDSVIGVSGEITLFKRSRMPELDQTSLTEDFDMSLKIRSTGDRVKYVPEAIVAEVAAGTFHDEIIQKKRRVIGTILTLWKYKKMLFNPKYGWFGLLILPSHKLLPMLSPFMVIGAFLSLLLVLGPQGSVLMLVITAVLLLLLFMFRNFKLFIPFTYFIEIQIIVLLGWIDLLGKRYKVAWDKIESSRL